MTIKLVVKYKVPSLNRLFKIGPMGRFQERKKAHRALLSELQRSAHDSLTQTTSARSLLLTACDTLALYLTTARRTSRSPSARSAAARERKGLK